MTFHCKGCGRWPVVLVTDEGENLNVSCICENGYDGEWRP